MSVAIEQQLISAQHADDIVVPIRCLLRFPAERFHHMMIFLGAWGEVHLAISAGNLDTMFCSRRVHQPRSVVLTVHFVFVSLMLASDWISLSLLTVLSADDGGNRVLPNFFFMEYLCYLQ